MLIVRPGFTMNADLWHKVYPMTKSWKTFVHQRTRPRGPFEFPFLQHLWAEGKFPAHFFKKWWINVSEVCLMIRFFFGHDLILLDLQWR
jgi:hypothetical protein